MLVAAVTMTGSVCDMVTCTSYEYQ